MNHYTAHLSSLLLEGYQNAAARLQLPSAALPHPGQYLQAYDATDGLAAVAIQLFAASHQPAMQEGEISQLAVAGPLPAGWQPGTQLRLRGPLGRGFSLPPNTRRLALAAVGRNAARLLPLTVEADAVAVFSDEPVGELPRQFEIQPLAALPTALAWADFLALDLPPAQIDELPGLLGIHGHTPKTLRGQALVTPPMPCGGLAQCGVCSFATPRKARLACAQGPVFKLTELLPAT